MRRSARPGRATAATTPPRIWARVVPAAPRPLGSTAFDIILRAVSVVLPDGRRLSLVGITVAADRFQVEVVAARMREPGGVRALAPRRPGPWEQETAPLWDRTRKEQIMTDKELSIFGERLYEAVLLTPLSAGTIFGLQAAVRQNIPWDELPQHLKFAVFKIAAACADEAEPAETARGGAKVATATAAASAADLAAAVAGAAGETPARPVAGSTGAGEEIKANAA